MRKLLSGKHGFAQLVPMVLTIVIVFALLFVGGYVVGEIDQSLEDSLPDTSRRGIHNTTAATMNNTSANWDSTLNIVQVVIIITVLASAIGAIFLFTRFR